MTHRIGQYASVNKETRRQLSLPFRREFEQTERVAETLVGQSESDATAAAESAGITVRIARRDGRSFTLHRDFRPSRVNLTVESGIVTAVSAG
jgi:hypothetical protein